jgi:hypothetical protein
MSTTDFCSIFSFKLFITPPGPSLLTATLFPETPFSLRSCGLWTLSPIDIAHQRTKPAVHAMAELIFHHGREPAVQLRLDAADSLHLGRKNVIRTLLDKQ